MTATEQAKIEFAGGVADHMVTQMLRQGDAEVAKQTDLGGQIGGLFFRRLLVNY